MSNDPRDGNLERLIAGAGPTPAGDARFKEDLWNRLATEQDRLKRRAPWIRFGLAAAVLLVAAGAFLLAKRPSPPIAPPAPAAAEARRLPIEVTALLADADEEVRLYAVETIARFGGDEHVSAVARMATDDQSPAVRRASRAALHAVWDREESTDERRKP